MVPLVLGRRGNRTPSHLQDLALPEGELLFPGIRVR